MTLWVLFKIFSNLYFVSLPLSQPLLLLILKELNYFEYEFVLGLYACSIKNNITIHQVIFM